MHENARKLGWYSLALRGKLSRTWETRGKLYHAITIFFEQHVLIRDSRSKEIMTAANVPCVPGYHGQNQDPEVEDDDAAVVDLFEVKIEASLAIPAG